MSTVKKIDDYFQKLPSWSKEICLKIRKIIYNADPEVEEVLKWGQPVFMYKGKLLCFVWAFKKHINFTFYQGALINDHAGLFANEKNLRSRTIYIKDIAQINDRTLNRYVNEAVRLINEGKEVKVPITKDKTVVVPSKIKKILKDNKLLDSFNSQIYTYRKGYVQWITQAKREETKERRIKIMLSELRSGKIYMGMPRKGK